MLAFSVSYELTHGSGYQGSHYAQERAQETSSHQQGPMTLEVLLVVSLPRPVLFGEPPQGRLVASETLVLRRG